MPRNASRLGYLHHVYSTIMLRVAGPPHPARVQGVAYVHADFLLVPRHLAHAPPLGDVWSARSGLYPSYTDPCCFRLKSNGAFSRLAGPGGWSANWRQCTQATAQLNTNLSGALFDECCYGWSDMIYVPSSALAEFARLSTAMRHIFHEVAVPTALNFLVHRGLVPSWRLMPRCQGSSVTVRLEMQQLWAMADGYCGHRIDLSGPYQRSQLRHLLAAN